jgi:hypothetical protein
LGLGEESDGAGGFVLGEEFLRGEEEADTWDPASVRERGEARTDSGYNPGGLWAGSGNRPNGFHLAFSISFSFFFFCFSELFQIFCKIASNHFKQNPKFLKSSKQPSKPIRSKFSETKQDF